MTSPLAEYVFCNFHESHASSGSVREHPFRSLHPARRDPYRQIVLKHVLSNRYFVAVATALGLRRRPVRLRLASGGRLAPLA
jgi:hypothetical protein